MNFHSYFYMWPIVCVQNVIGAGMMYQIIKYLKSKQLGFQTLLDNLYIQLMEYWIIEASMYSVAFILFEMEVTNWILAWIIGFGTYLSIVLSSIHLMVCLLFQIVLILFQDKIEGFEDQKILSYTRQVLKVFSTFKRNQSPSILY